MPTDPVPQPKARQAVLDAINGDMDSVEPATRRALIAVAQELDEHRVEQRMQIRDLINTIEAGDKRLEKKLSWVTGLLTATTVTFVTAMGTGLLNLILN